MVSVDHGTKVICARMRLISFNRLREECTHEEARLITIEENMGETENQSLIVHTRNNYKKKEKKDKFHQNKNTDTKQNNTKRDPSSV